MKSAIWQVYKEHAKNDINRALSSGMSTVKTAIDGQLRGYPLPCHPNWLARFDIVKHLLLECRSIKHRVPMTDFLCHRNSA